VVIFQGGVSTQLLIIDNKIDWLELSREEIMEQKDSLLAYTSIDLVIRASFIIDQEFLKILPNLSRIGLISTGDDNIDFKALKEYDIEFFHFPGENSMAVKDYIVFCLVSLWQITREKPMKIGIVGFGNVGSKVASFCKKAQIEYEVYDPFIKQYANKERLYDCHLLTFHVPLTKKVHPTFEMLNEQYFAHFKQIPLIIQTSRGKIWQEEFYKRLLDNSKVFAQDVYTSEPSIDKSWLHSLIATPHIAGYSTIGRLRGLEKVVVAMFNNFITLEWPKSTAIDLLTVSESFKKNYEKFDLYRDHFPFRKEFHEYNVVEQNEMKNLFNLVKDKTLWQAVFECI